MRQSGKATRRHRDGLGRGVLRAADDGSDIKRNAAVLLRAGSGVELGQG